MKLSVIVAAYNEVEYIDQAIESVVNQKNVDLNEMEILIGDDGSSDGTIEKINEWQRRMPALIKPFVMERPDDLKNIIASVRVSNVLKRAIRMAEGDYICFVAGDDFYCDDHFLSEHLQHLERPENRDCVGCMCDYYKYWNDSHKELVQPPHNKQNKLKASHYWGCHMYTHLSSFVFRNVFKQYGFYPDDMNFIDDIGMEFLMGQYGDFCYIPKAMFAYRQREGSIMRKNDPNDNRLCSMLLYAEIRRSDLNRYKMAAYSRVVGNVKSLFIERKRLADSKYDKYFNLSAGKDKAFTSWVTRGEKGNCGWFTLKIAFLYACYLPYRILRLIQFAKQGE